MQGLKYALRYLRRNVGFSLFAVVGLGLGIAGCTTLFAISSAVFLRYRDLVAPDRIAFITAERVTPGAAPMPDLLSYNEGMSLARAHQNRVALFRTTPRFKIGANESIAGAVVTPNFFSILQARAVRGRLLLEDDARASQCAVVVTRNLQRRSGGGADIGASANVEGVDCVVIGIVDQAGELPEEAEAWAVVVPRPDQMSQSSYQGITRFSERAAADAAQNAAFRPFRITPLLQTRARGLDGTGFNAVGVAVALTLLMALLNVATFYLSRSNRRANEYALCLALGASGGRIARQLATEVMVICTAASAVGVLLSLWATRIAVAMLPGLHLEHRNFFDARVVVLALVITLASLAAVAAIPIYQILVSSKAVLLRDGGYGVSVGRRAAWTRRSSLCIQLGCVVLMLCFGEACRLYIKRSAALDVGVDATRVKMISVNLPSDDMAEQIDLSRVLSVARSANGADGDNVAAWMPRSAPFIDQSGWAQLVPVREKLPPGQRLMHYYEVTPKFFDIIGARVMEGRVFNDNDNAASQPVIVITEPSAKKWWPGESPIGKHIRFGSRSDLPVLTVVGVVNNMQTPDELGRNFVTTRPDASYPLGFIPWSQRNLPSQYVRQCLNCGTLYVGLGGNASSAASRRIAERAFQAEYPGATTSSGTLLELQLGTYEFSRSILARRVLGVFTIVSGILALIGIWAASEEAVRQLKRELGIRAALGASPLQMLRRAVVENFLAALIGTCVGSAICVAGLRSIARFSGVMPYAVTITPGHVGLLGLVLVCIAGIALLIAARGSMHISPRSALHAD